MEAGHNDNDYIYNTDNVPIAYWDDNKIMWILFKEFENVQITWIKDYPDFRRAFSEEEALEIMKTDKYKNMYGPRTRIYKEELRKFKMKQNGNQNNLP